MLKLFDTTIIIDYTHVFMIRLRYYDHPGSQDKVSLLISTKTYDKSASSSVYTNESVVYVCVSWQLYTVYSYMCVAAYLAYSSHIKVDIKV